jgi:hypothetical protein
MNIGKNPMANPYACEICKYKCHKQSNLKLHMNTRKHLNAIRESPRTSGETPKAFRIENLAENTYALTCEPCGFATEKRADFERHKQTQKHKRAMNDVPETAPTPDSCAPFSGETASEFGRENVSGQLETLTGVVIQMVKQNTEFQRILVETQQQTQKQYAELLASYRESRSPVVQQTTNNHFNLQVFLNIQCKDAINMSDFIQGLNIQPKDIAQFGQLGFVGGITRIFMDGLNGLEQHKRPIHCTDTKRDIMYIKDADRWERDNENARLLHAIETVEQRNCRLFTKTIFPDMNDERTMCHYMSIMHEVNGGSSREKNRAKIVKNISKACCVNRTGMLSDGI